MRLVGLGPAQPRRVVSVASGGQAGVRRIYRVGDLFFGDAGREIADGLVAEGIPVRDGDAVGVEAVILLAHGSCTDASAANRVAPGRHQMPWNFVMRPSATIET